MRDRTERFRQVCLGRLGASQGINVGAAPGIPEQFVQIFGVRGKALLVVRFAPQPRDRDIVDAGVRRYGGHQQAHQDPPHTTPHLRRNSHSVDMSSSSHRNTTGMFHSSLISLTEMPASE
jgi:hypothetical protein